MSHRSLADLLIEVAGGGAKQLTELPAERRAIDPGKVYLSYEKIRRELGWQPRIDLREGLARTIAYYRQHRDRYWNARDVAEQQIGGLQLGPQVAALTAPASATAPATPATPATAATAVPRQGTAPHAPTPAPQDAPREPITQS
jgi:hypothetical protein